MNSETNDLEIRKFIEKYRGKIGQQWVDYERSIEEVMCDTTITIKGWNEEISWDAIKKWAVVNNDFNALWLDEEYAQKSRWGGIIAPPLFLESVDNGLGPAMAMTFESLEKQLFQQSFNASTEWEFFKPSRPGDKITAKSKIVDLTEKQGSRGKLLMTTVETIYTNQKGQHVATKRATVIYVWESKFAAQGALEKDLAGPQLPRFSDQWQKKLGEFETRK